MVAPAAYGAVVLAKLLALKAGAIFATIKIAGISYKIIYAGCKIIGTVSQYCFVATAGAALVAGAVYVTKECFVLVSKILGRSVDGDDIQEFASRMFSAALQAGIAVGEAGLALYLSPATLGGVLVLALAALYAYDAFGGPTNADPYGNDPFFNGLGSGFSSHCDRGGNFPRGVPVFTGYHPVPHDTFSGAEVKEKMNDGIRARKAAARGTKPSDDYKEAYIEIIDF